MLKSNESNESVKSNPPLLGQTFLKSNQIKSKFEKQPRINSNLESQIRDLTQKIKLNGIFEEKSRISGERKSSNLKHVFDLIHLILCLDGNGIATDGTMEEHREAVATVLKRLMEETFPAILPNICLIKPRYLLEGS